MLRTGSMEVKWDSYPVKKKEVIKGLAVSGVLLASGLTVIGVATYQNASAINETGRITRTLSAKVLEGIESQKGSVHPGEVFIECKNLTCVRAFITKAPTSSECGTFYVESGGLELNTGKPIRVARGAEYDICLPK